MGEKPKRSTGTATITFGMVVIPAKLYAATESKDAVSFNLLHGRNCGSRLKQQYVCLKDGQVVERDDMVKGYEHAKDQYVTFTPDELKQLAAESTEAIEICEFVPAGSVEPIYLDGKASYLAPEKAGAQAFALLLAAMGRSGREAIGKYAARGKQYVVLLRPAAGALVVHTLRYAGEVRDPVDVPEAKFVDALLDLAQKLVEQKSSPAFDPGKYRDEVSERVLAAIERKVGGDLIALPPVEKLAPASDLMAALQASMRSAA